MALCTLAIAAVCSADSIWDYQAVKADGNGSHPLVNAPAYDAFENLIVGNRVTIEGVALNSMSEIWKADGPMSLYSIFIQDEIRDRGGIQVWAGNYGWYHPPVVWRPAQYVPFSAGDRVRVTGFLGDNRGKVFINDRHTNDLDVCFTVEVIGHSGMPEPELIPSIANCNYFDQSRIDGGERYQTRWSMLHNVEVVSGPWENGGRLTIADTTGNVGLFLAPMGDFSATPAPTSKITIVGIFDQEDYGTGNPPNLIFHGSYRMILKNSSDIAASLNSCREVRDRTVGEQVALANKVVSRAFDGCFYIQDADRSGGIKVLSNSLVTAGDAVSVMGSIMNENGEACLIAKYVAKSRLAAAPLGVNGKTLGGESGLDVFGLLVRCVGSISHDIGNGFYQFIDDTGSAVLLNSNGYEVPALGTMVKVTAVASGNPSSPVLLLGSTADIEPVN